ncbi:galactosylceramide sulfotransferase-like [Ptychodera flava]|uniref:galactosylceramide sulfotransferase-like n=1 Tax=Ptychodera flava TaxID=63121 RepID=UPI00396A0200
MMLCHYKRRLFCIFVLVSVLTFSSYLLLYSGTDTNYFLISKGKGERSADFQINRGKVRAEKELNEPIMKWAPNLKKLPDLQPQLAANETFDEEDVEGVPMTGTGELFDCPPPPKWLNGRQPCRPAKKIMFLKTRRTGSSTVQNILFRYGEKHNLNFALPREGIQFSDVSGMPFQRSQMMKTNHTPEGYDILCHYARFNEPGLSSVISDGGIYITTLRDPTSQFESIFTHMRLDKLFRVPGNNLKSSFRVFMEKPEKFYSVLSSTLRRWAKNPMLFDLGIAPQEMLHLRQVDNYVQYLDRKFDFVILREYFDESLILLKKLLCLDFQDIAYVEHNVRSAAAQFTDTTAEGLDSQVLRWNMGDARLYEHFKEKTLCLIRHFGNEKMRREVMKLREMNEKYYDLCVEDILNDGANVWSPANSRAIAYKLKEKAVENEMCVNLVKPEYIYTRELRHKFMTNISQKLN